MFYEQYWSNKIPGKFTMFAREKLLLEDKVIVIITPNADHGFIVVKNQRFITQNSFKSIHHETLKNI